MRAALAPASDLPRERLEKLGAHALSLGELLAILLRTGDRNRNVLQVGSGLLVDFGGLRGLSRASFRELLDVGGLGKAKACSLLAALELGRRLCAEERSENEDLERETPRACLTRWSVELATEQREFIVAAFADGRDRVMEEERISCLLYTSPSPRDRTRSRMPSSA